MDQWMIIAISVVVGFLVGGSYMNGIYASLHDTYGFTYGNKTVYPAQLGRRIELFWFYFLIGIPMIIYDSFILFGDFLGSFNESDKGVIR